MRSGYCTRHILWVLALVNAVGIGAYLCSGNRRDTPKTHVQATSEVGDLPQPEALAGQTRPLEVPVVGASRREELPAPMVIPGQRRLLARELQKELKRVGCYKGPLNGTWTSSTRRAMALLVERVNASLPTGEPDATLYALTHAQPPNACRSCPMGQSFDAQGRCTPTAILNEWRRTSKISSDRSQRMGPASWSSFRVTEPQRSSSHAGPLDHGSTTKAHASVRRSNLHSRRRRTAERVHPRSHERSRQQTWLRLVFGSQGLH
jgi:hypothetical protein